MIDLTLFEKRDTLKALGEIWKMKGFELEAFQRPDKEDYFGMRPRAFSVKQHSQGSQMDLTAYSESDRELIRVVYDNANASSVNYVTAAAIGRCVAEGPKAFLPTPLQCEAMGQVEVNLRPEQIQLPFPTLAIILPEAYRETLRREYPEALPEEIPVAAMVADLPMVGHVSHSLICISQMGGTAKQGIVFTCRGNNPKELEYLMGIVRDTPMDESPTYQASDRDINVARRVQRVAFNCALLLASEPTLTVPLYPKDRAKHKLLASSPNAEKRARGRQLLQTSFDRVIPNQKITFHVEEHQPQQPGQPTGRTVRAHWRRGHYRTLDASKGFFKTSRVVMIPPVRVAWEKVPVHTASELPPSTVTYKGRD
jgi:hypothetical protein